MAVKVSIETKVEGKVRLVDPADHPKVIEGARVYVRVDHRGQRKSTYVGIDSRPTREAAARAAAVISGKLASDDLTPLAPKPESVSGTSDPLVKHMVVEWAEWHQKSFPRRQNTIENYESFISTRLVPALGDRRVSTLTRAVIQDWIAETRKAVAYTTLTSVFVPVFRKILDFCVEREYLTVNPFRSGGRLFEPSDSDREAAPAPDPFSPKELTLILGAAHQIDPAFGVFLRTWSQLGARSGEVRALQVKDLDVKAGTVSISKTLHSKAGRVWTGPTKSPKRSNRVASLLSAVATDLKPEALLSRLAKHVAGKAADDFIFTKPSGGAITAGSLRNRWARALDLAGIRFREVEQLRHTYISAALSRGENILKVARQTGHTVAVLLAHYARFIPEAVDASGHKPAASAAKVRRRAA